MLVQRTKTGIEGLDELLYGGFLEGDAILVAGSPGTGKTSLGMQFIYNGITRQDEPGCFITFEEFPQQIYRDALSFGWDFRALEEENRLKVLFTSPDLMHQDMQRQEGLIPEMMREVGARRVVVDSISHFQRLAEDPGHYREIIYGLINGFKREGLTSLLIRELTESEVPGTGREEYVADAVLYLTREWVGNHRMRFLEVIKNRGSRAYAARSLFFIGDHGIRVIPAHREAAFRFAEAASTGIARLDQLIGGGIPYGGFYVLELDSNLHERLFDINFVGETLRSGDTYIQIADDHLSRDDLSALARDLGMTGSFEAAEQAGQVHLFGSAAASRGDADGAVFGEPRKIIAAVSGIYRQTGNSRKVRLQVNLSKLITELGESTFYPTLAGLVNLNRTFGGVAFGTLTPGTVPEEAREKVRTIADGIIRIWTSGGYNYLQVIKTLNSVRTPTYAFLETSEPPFVDILGE
jgi:circadian clock protein KaiC